MLKLQRLASYTILLFLVLMSCNTQTAQPTATPTETAIPTSTATPIPTSTFTPIPTSTFTPSPTSTDTPTATITSSPTPSCNADEVLKDIKANLQLDEFEVYYNTIQNTTSLAIWYVENEIDPVASGDDIEQNGLLALRSAAMTSQQLARQNICVEKLFTVINPIVVDENYNGWFSGQVEPSILPDGESPSESELEAIENSCF